MKKKIILLLLGILLISGCNNDKKEEKVDAVSYVREHKEEIMKSSKDDLKLEIDDSNDNIRCIVHIEEYNQIADAAYVVSTMLTKCEEIDASIADKDNRPYIYVWFDAFGKPDNIKDVGVRCNFTFKSEMQVSELDILNNLQYSYADSMKLYPEKNTGQYAISKETMYAYPISRIEKTVVDGKAHDEIKLLYLYDRKNEKYLVSNLDISDYGKGKDIFKPLLSALEYKVTYGDNIAEWKDTMDSWYTFNNEKGFHTYKNNTELIVNTPMYINDMESLMNITVQSDQTKYTMNINRIYR